MVNIGDGTQYHTNVTMLCSVIFFLGGGGFKSLRHSQRKERKCFVEQNCQLVTLHRIGQK